MSLGPCVRMFKLGCKAKISASHPTPRFPISELFFQLTDEREETKDNRKKDTMFALRLLNRSAVPAGRRVAFYSTETSASPLMTKFR